MYNLIPTFYRFFYLQPSLMALSASGDSDGLDMDIEKGTLEGYHHGDKEMPSQEEDDDESDFDDDDDYYNNQSEDVDDDEDDDDSEIDGVRMSFLQVQN